MSRELKTTLICVVTAVACLAVTGLFEILSQPAPIEEYGRVGEEFYPDFTDPTQAKSLSVMTVDQEDVTVVDFSVEQLDNGRWVIPSHHNYPADATLRLAQTASSIVGITRGAMVTRWSSDHAQYGVVDPQGDKLYADEVAGIGRRLTLKAKNDEVLADFVIGNQVEGSPGNYYVRKPDEDEVYITDLEIELSTRFADWINTDLLELDDTQLVNLEFSRQKRDELRGVMVQGDVTTLQRENPTAAWSLAGFDDPAMELNNTAVGQVTQVLGDLAIVGVRPKQEGVTPDLKLDRTALRSQRDLDRLQADLLNRGFQLRGGNENDPDQLSLVSSEGDLNAATAEGLVYKLYFGRAFTGNQEELEMGFASTEDETAANESDADEATGEGEGGEDDAQDDGQATDNTDSEETETEQPNGKKPGRYLFVTVDFDPTWLGPELTQPLAPEKSPELLEAEAEVAALADEDAKSDETESQEDENSDAESADDQDDQQSDEQTTDEPQEPEETPQQRLARLQAEFAAQQQLYQQAVREFEAYEQAKIDGQARADELNRRFASWYYVIPGESFDQLALKPESLVQPKTPDTPNTPQNNIPNLPNLNFPNLNLPE